MKTNVHICCFEAVGPIRRRVTYEEFRERVLAAGRFSAFEATENQRTARLYDRLTRDPTVVFSQECGFPWTTVRRR